MQVFGLYGRRPIKIWGPAVGIKVKIPALGGGSWVLSGLSIGAKEITDVRQCFGDISFIYALGNDQDKCRITLDLLIFLGKEYCAIGNNSKAIGSCLSAYSRKRISQMTAPMTVTIGNFSVKTYLVEIGMGNYDADRSLLHCQVSFIMELP